MIWNSLRSAWKLAAAAMMITGAFCGQANAVNDVNSLWNFESAATTNVAGQTPPGQPFSPEEGFTGDATAFHANATTVWSTPAGNGSSKSLSANDYSVGDYFQFHTDNSSHNSNFGFQFDQVSSTTGPRDWQVQYSTNGTTFTDLPGGSYSVQPNANPAWSSAGAVAPTGLDTYTFDLRSITALNTANDIYLRLTTTGPLVVGGAGAAQLGSTFATTGTDRVDNAGIFYNFDPSQPNTTSIFGVKIKQPFAPPVLPTTGDVVLGLGSGRTSTTLELVRGTVTPGGATRPAPLSPWTTQNFTRFVKFDNLGGAAHNVHGNLLAVDPGGSATNGGNIYSYATQGTQPLPAPQLLATTNTASGAATRLGGLSVSPDNTKIALAGFDTGKVLVYDYTAGNSFGSGTPSLSGLRQSAAILGTGANYAAGSQQGTAWKDNSTVLAFAGDGKLYTVDATTMANTQVANVGILTATQSSTALAYNPAVSPYVYATYSSFVSTGAVTTNKLYIFNPAAGYADLTTGGLDFSTSTPNTIRDIALDASGNLIMSTNASSSTPSGNSARLEYVTAADLAALTPNSAVEWFYDDIFQSQPGFTGLDIGFAPPAGTTGDYNNDGKVDAADYVVWRKAQGTTTALPNDPVGGTIGTAQFNNWRANFGKSPGAGSGLSGTSVPEPASIVLLLVGLAAFGSRCRKG